LGGMYLLVQNPQNNLIKREGLALND